MTSVKGFVAGRVQGVGFRYFVKRSADSAGLAGYVRNLPDGRVEFLLQGDGASVDSVVEKIQTGPDYAQVSDVSFEELIADTVVQGFSIR